MLLTAFFVVWKVIAEELPRIIWMDVETPWVQIFHHFLKQEQASRAGLTPVMTPVMRGRQGKTR